MLPVLIFFLLASFIFLLSQKISAPFDFISYLSFPPRAFLYSAVHARNKPTELDMLKQENIVLRSKLVKLDALQKDNNALRGQFEDAVLSSQTLLPAKVIGFSGSFNNPTELLLDEGENSGVKKGMAVVSGHVLVGKIGKVTPWNSKLILTVSKKFSTLGVLSKNNTTGVIKGEDNFILFDHVVITDSLTNSETVVTKGEADTNGIGIPANLIVGKVANVNKSDTSPFQSAFIKPLIDFSKLTTVFVITNN